MKRTDRTARRTPATGTLYFAGLGLLVWAATVSADTNPPASHALWPTALAAWSRSRQMRFAVQSRPAVPANKQMNLVSQKNYFDANKLRPERPRPVRQLGADQQHGPAAVAVQLVSAPASTAFSRSSRRRTARRAAVCASTFSSNLARARPLVRSFGSASAARTSPVVRRRKSAPASSCTPRSSTRDWFRS